MSDINVLLILLFIGIAIVTYPLPRARAYSPEYRRLGDGRTLLELDRELRNFVPSGEKGREE